MLLIQKEKPAIPSTQAGRYNEKNHYPLPASGIISQAEKLSNSIPEVNTMTANGKLFLYFEKKGQYVEAEIKQGRINILPAVSELADFSVVPPTNSIISQAEELSSSIPEVNTMTANGNVIGVAYDNNILLKLPQCCGNLILFQKSYKK